MMVEEIEILDYHEKITTVRLDFAVHEEAVSRGMIEMTEPVGEAAVYSIDETGLVRTDTDHRDVANEPVQENTSDPLKKGNLLVCFE